MAWAGTLNNNEVFSAIKNMIISQEVFADPIRGGFELADTFKTDGSLYGDTKLFYSVQIPGVQDWTGDSEAANLLSLNRPAAPNCQAVTIDVKKMIPLTVDSFLTKRAWGTEGVFSQFNSVILGTMRDAKKVYEGTMMNVCAGTTSTSTGSQTQTVTFVAGDDDDFGQEDIEAANRLNVLAFGKTLADTIVNLEDVSTQYNDLGYLRKYDANDFILIMNSDFYNQIRYVDLPTIFHNDVIEGLIKDAKVINSRYFGTVNASATNGDGSTVRALVEGDYENQTSGGDPVHLRAGDLIPATHKAGAGKSYTVDAKALCKLVHKDAIKYMSAFETETEFFNPRSLTSNHYLIFMHSNPQNSRLSEYPWVSINKA